MCSADMINLNVLPQQPYMFSIGLNGLGSTTEPICMTSVAKTNILPAMCGQQQQRSRNPGEALRYTVPLTTTTYSSGKQHVNSNTNATFISAVTNWQGAQPQPRSTMTCHPQPSTAPNYAQPSNVFMQSNPSVN